MANPAISQAAAKTLGLPPGMKTYSPFPFAGMNTQASALAIQDSEFQYLENFVRLGEGRLRTVWDRGAPLYTAPAGKSVVYFMFFTISTEYFCAVFLDDGSAVQIDVTTAAQVVIGASGFYDPTAPLNLPFAKQWGSTYLLICNRNTSNDYWVWDGSIMYGSGAAAPNGVTLLSGGFGYTFAPTATAYGGSGSGMAFDVSVDAGAVVDVQTTSAGSGYKPGDVVQIQFTGGGSDDSAVLEAFLTGSQIGGATVLTEGFGYTTAAVVFSGGGGGIDAAADAIIVDSKIVRISITNSGSGYTSVPDITITGDGSGATGYVVLEPQGVASVTVIDGGTGFISVPLISFVGGRGAGATGVVRLTATTVAVANVTAGGSGYTSAPTVTVTGGGAGVTPATISAHIVGDSVGYLTVDDPGAGYTEAAELTFTGGGGSGAGGVVLFAPTSIDSVVVSSAGQFYTSAPAVEVQAGANGSAYAIVALMPYGVSGSAMETFLSRVWIIDPATPQFGNIPPGNLYSFSAPSSVTDFSTSGGGGDSQNTDSFLQTRYVGIRQSAGYLYLYGDGSVSVISNVNTAGTPVVTTYNYQNVDPQGGLAWRDAIEDFGRSTIVANETGAYGLYGGALTSISQKMQQFFNDAIYPDDGGVTPSSATATIFNVKHYVQLLTIRDSETGATRNVLAMWNEKDWTVASQNAGLVQIATEKQKSRYRAWGSDGQSVFPLFDTPSTAISKRLITKQYGADRPFLSKTAMAYWVQIQNNSGDAAPVTGTMELEISGIGIIPVQGQYATLPSEIFQNPALTEPSVTSQPPFWPLMGSAFEGHAFITAAMRYASTAPDFTLGNMAMGYIEAAGMYGMP